MSNPLALCKLAAVVTITRLARSLRSSATQPNALPGYPSGYSPVNPEGDSQDTPQDSPAVRPGSPPVTRFSRPDGQMGPYGGTMGSALGRYRLE